MKKFLTIFLGLVCALCFNSAAGAAVASVIEVQPLYGALAANGISIVTGALGGLAPAGALRAGLLTEVWTGFMINAFRTDPSALGWYDKIRSFDQYAENDVIHFVNIGGDPKVLVNNTTYPLAVETLADGDKAVSLDKFQTLPSQITDDEMYALSYDKKSSVIARHKEVMKEKIYSRAIHALAPTGNTSATPVIATTGGAVEGRKALTLADVVRLKKAFDKNKVPLADRVLVLCPDHIADLLQNEQRFAQQYYNYETGKVAKLYGFEVYEYNDCPYYNATALTKNVYGAVPSANDNQASVAFSPQRMMKANGSVTAYASEAKSNPETQANLLNFRAYSICLPLKDEAMGAIVSAKA